MVYPKFIQHFVRRQIDLKIRFYLSPCLTTSDSRNIVFYYLLCACVCVCVCVFVRAIVLIQLLAAKTQ